MSEIVTLNVPDLRPVIESKIQAAIVAELGKAQSVLEGIVAATLRRTVKVDRTSGQLSDYGYEMPYLQWLCEMAIRQQTESALKESVAAIAPKIKAALIAELKNHPERLAEKMLARLGGLAENSYYIRTNVEFKNCKD